MKVMSELKMAATLKNGIEGCENCPLMAVVEPTDAIIHELIAAIDRANKAIPVLNLAIKERDIEIAKLSNALDRHAMKALQGNKYN